MRFQLLRQLSGLGLGWFLLCQAAAVSATSLSEAVEAALVNSDQILAQQAAVEAAEWQSVAVDRSRWPRVGATAAWRHQTEVPRVQINLEELPPPAGPLQTEFDLGVHNTREAGLQANWLAFGGFAPSSQAAISRHQTDWQRRQLEVIRCELAGQVVRLYRAGQSLVLQIRILETGNERIDNHLAQLRSLIAATLASPYDTLALRRARNDQQRRLMQLQAELAHSRATLLQLTGVPVTVEPFRGTSDPALPPLRMDLDPQLSQLETEARILAERRRLTAATLYPSLQFQAGWRWGRPGLNPTLDEWMSYGIIGAGLNWEIWNGGVRRAEREAVTAAEQALRSRREAVRSNLSTRYDNAVIMYHALESELTVVEQNLSLARRQLQGIEARQAEGVVSGSELRDTLLELTALETEAVLVRLRLALQRTVIEQLSGLPPAEWSLE